MNTKRQTIWLVSMLGLMVVLSAYYLFTDNVGDLETTGEDNVPTGTVIESVEVGDNADLPDLNELAGTGAGGEHEWMASGLWEELAGEADQVHGEGMETGDLTASSDSAPSGDEAILERVQAGAQSGEEYIAALEMERTHNLSKEIESLFNVALDQSKSPEEVARADERLRYIEETQAIVDDLEGQLLQQFENVVIAEMNGKWNVVVKSPSLDRGEVVKIIDMVMEGLNISANQIVVERVS